MVNNPRIRCNFFPERIINGVPLGQVIGGMCLKMRNSVWLQVEGALENVTWAKIELILNDLRQDRVCSLRRSTLVDRARKNIVHESMYIFVLTDAPKVILESSL